MGSYLSMRRIWGRMASRCGQRQADCRVRSATDATDATPCLVLLPVLVPEKCCRPLSPVATVPAVAVPASPSLAPAKAATCTDAWDEEEFGWDVSSKYCRRLGGGGGATGRLMFCWLWVFSQLIFHTNGGNPRDWRASTKGKEGLFQC